ncbi:MAG: hypothetical protein WBN22_01870 [Verrucomicrobiia bacterium]
MKNEEKFRAVEAGYGGCDDGCDGGCDALVAKGASDASSPFGLKDEGLFPRRGGAATLRRRGVTATRAMLPFCLAFAMAICFIKRT